MNKRPANGVKLTTVIFAVAFLALSAMLSNTSLASYSDTQAEVSQ